MNILTSEDVDSITSASNNVTLMVSFLDKKGLGILNLFDNVGRTMLHLVIDCSGNVACVQLLLEKKANPNAVSGIDDQCSTPLHYAARAGNLACIIALLKHGANVDMRNSKGKLAIDLAEDNGSTECIDYLKAIYAHREKEEELKKAEALYRSVNNCDFNGAKQALDSMKSSYTIVNEYCYDGNETLLNNACRLGERNIVMLLIHNQADGLRRNIETGETSLYIACCYGHSDVVVLLVQEFPKLLEMPCHKEQIYPLHAAIIYCKESIVEYLLTLRNGIRKEKTDQVKKKMNRSLNDSSAFLALSLQSNNYFVNINQPMATGIKPLHLAVIHENKNILSMLLACKPFIKEIESEKYASCLILDSTFDTKTPLHLALQNGNVEIAELLLENGADFNISFMDSDNICTPLQYICRNEKIDLLELLLKYKVEDYNGISLNEAMENDRDKVVNLLLSNGIFLNIEGTLKLTSNDFEDKLTPISIYWKKRYISCLKEKWILAAPLSIYSNLNSGINNELLSQLITDVSLSDNNLEFVPFVLFQLPSLKKLNLSYNKLAELPCSTKEFSQISRESDFNIYDKNLICLSLEGLDLQHNELTVLPDYIFQMHNLQSINCSHNKLHKLPFEMWLSESLKVLILHHNCLSQLPVLVSNGNFKREKFNEKVPDQIDNRLFRNPFSKEKFLYSRKLIWEDVSINIENKEPNSGLIQLDLSHNKFSEVPDGVACLAPNLFDLNLSHNEISDISYISAFPKHISHLKLAKNNIEKLDFSEKLKPNTGCYACLENTYPSTFDKGICQHRQHTKLFDLAYLDLSGNRLSSVNFFTSFNNQKNLFCENLLSLNISDNFLKRLPDGIKNLGKLNSLFFTQNTNIDDLLLEQLQYMSNNENIISQPLSQSIKAGCERNSNIKFLLKAEEAKEFFPNIKLMFVGPHKVGKTMLLNSLRKEGKGSYQQINHLGHYYDRVKGSSISTNTLATVGVDVSDWTYTYEKKHVKFSTWDFAGEDKYSVTHHFFLCQDAVYLLVWQTTNELQNKMGSLKKWLHIIQVHAPDSAVIIVRINIDNKVFPPVPPEKVKKKFVSKTNGGDIDNPSDVGLPNVIDYIEVDSNKSSSIKILCDLIAKTAMTLKDKSNVSILEQTFPESYQAIEKAVFVVADRMKNEKNRYLDDNSFRLQMYELLHLQNIELKFGDEEIYEAVQFLHKFGSILHFKTSALNDTYFVNPQWLCDILAFIITIVSPETNGLIEISDIEKSVISEKFSISTCIDLLNRFDIAVELSNKTLFIPSLLPAKQADCSTHSGSCQTYLQNEVFRRQYIMSYVPRGFWAMLIKRIRSDNDIYEALLSCCNLQTSASSQVQDTQQSLDVVKKFLEWSCWKTGIELSYFGFKLLRICKLDAGVAFYGSNSFSIPTIVLNPASDLSNQVVFEIVVPVITVNIGKNQQVDCGLGNDDYEGSQNSDHNTDNFHVIGITHVNHQAACRLFVIAIEHMDNLLSEWFPQLDNHINTCGVRRLSFCNLCLENAIEGEKFSSKHLSKLSLFEVEQVLNCFKKSEDLVCPFHESKVLDIKMMFPDLFFLDANNKFMFNHGKIECSRLIIRGEFSDVFSVSVVSEGSAVKAAMKIPGNSIIGKNRVLLTNTESYLSYRVFREELTTILPIEHERIIKYKGVSFKPFAMFFELAPKGSLSSFLDKFKERKKELPSHIVTQTLQQVSDAINYLVSKGILCYDLKSENILVHEFPEPDLSANVQLLLAYYGTSQKMFNGMRGFKGKPGYVAPDVYFHKENSKSKVLSFLFGSFVYELINLRRPFGDCSNSYLINKFILEGRQPKLSIMGRRYPISVLSLLHQCWAVDPDDRPTSLEVKTLTSFKEFTSLLDVLALDENFYLQCVQTCDPKFCNRNVVSSQSLIGSHVWLISSRKNHHSMHQDTVVTVFSYEDFKYTHVINVPLKDKIVIACLVGNNMWLGTDKSSFKVYCTLKYQIVAFGEKINHACILCILHCPLIKRVFFTLSDGDVLVYSDDVRSPSRIDVPESPDSILHPITKIVQLTPLYSFSAYSPIHCICVFESNPAKKEKTAIPNDPDISLDESCLTPDKYELWCGQEKGILQIREALSFKELETYSVNTGKASPDLEPTNQTVTFLETNRFFISDNQNKKSLSSNVWMVVFPGTKVKRWNVNLRMVEGVFDTCRYVDAESHTVNSVKPQKKKITKVDQTQIQSLVVVESKMYVGTSFGILFTCDAYTMNPYTWLKCYNEYISIIVPFRMVSSCPDISQREKELLLTCGRKCKDRWLHKVDRENNQREKKISKNFSFALMTWNVNSFSDNF